MATTAPPDVEVAEFVVAGLVPGEADDALATRLMANDIAKALITEAWVAIRSGNALEAKRCRRELATLAAEGVAQETLEADLQTWGATSLTLNLLGLGSELGLFTKLALGPLTSAELASNAECDARYVQEWCLHMAASKVLSVDSAGKFSITEYASGCVNDLGKMALTYIIPAAIAMRHKMAEVYKTGEGYGFGELDHRMVCGTTYFTQTMYENHLVPALPEEVRSRFEAGCKVADVGCGTGAVCALLAEKFPNVQIVGYDYHLPSVEEARRLAKQRGLTNVSYEEACSSRFGQEGQFEVVTFFDSFHDMATATKAAKRAHACLKSGGVVYLNELLAAENDSIEDQLALPTARMFSGCSCHACLPCGKCDGGDALGTVVPTSKVRNIFVKEAGFKDLHSIASPLNQLGFRILVATK